VSGAVAILRAAARPAVPWRNGGGLTREVAAHPPGRGFDQLDWRISIAEIGTAGPFSAFPGLERRLAVLQGRLALAIGAQAPLEVGAGTPALHFAGDVLVHARPLDGTVTDLNVMTRRGRFTSTLTLNEATAVVSLGDGPATRVLLALDPLEVRAAGAAWQLAPLDAARCEAQTPLGVAPLATAARFYLIELRPVSG
jgi:environmental stress-induced protein Ves